MDTYFVVLAAVLGLIFGSFATAVAYRVPRHESIVSGRSRCPDCGATVTALENVPVFSWLFLRGKCRHCGKRISVRYPLIELATAVLFALAEWKFGVSLRAVAFAAFFWVLVVLTVIDLEHKLLPSRIIYPSIVAGAALLTADALIEGEPGRLVRAGVGSLIFGVFFFAIAFLVPQGMGMGDVRFAYLLGMFLGDIGGIGVVLVGMFLSFLSGGIIGGIAAAATRGGRKMKIPFGPFLAFGTVLAVFVGRPLLDAYLGTF
ncbi:MAG TPA: prepilin peptidase [Actinomycetota bacterium]|nr:prepilin peptidase [Actinomycetota bacterium]